MSLKVGISGLRGTVGGDLEDLTPEVVVGWVRAFAASVQREAGADALIAVGYDGRRSSPLFHNLVVGALQASGSRVLDLGLTLTPTVQYTVSTNPSLAGGVMITASHNPVIWNGLKFLDSHGRFLPLERWAEMEAILMEGAFRTVALDRVAPVQPLPNSPWERHMAAILDHLPVDAIRARRLRVALDACNSGAIYWQHLFDALGCEVVPLHTELTGFFAREPEPLPQHLATLAHLVCAAQCDVGLAADPDGDRLVLVDEQGQFVSEEHTVVLCAREQIAAGAGNVVVVNVVTTHAVEEALPNVEIWRTAVGEMNVVNGVLDAQKPALGGEGSGGIIVPGIHLARDGAAAAGLILSLLARTNATISRLVGEIPPWRSVKSKLDVAGGDLETARALFGAWRQYPPAVTTSSTAGSWCLHAASQAGTLNLQLTGERLDLSLRYGDAESMMAVGWGAGLQPLFEAIHASADSIRTTSVDGLKVWGDRSWLSLRPSNTEPIVRVMGEIRL